MAHEMTHQEISDRIQINDLLIRYTRAIDGKDWNLLDTCFVPDAFVDYVSSGGIKGQYPEVRTWLAKALAIFPMTVHFIGNTSVELHGETATARTFVFNPMGVAKEDGSKDMFTVGAWYNDKLVRTEEGWRIQERIEEQAYRHGMTSDSVAF